MGLKLIWAETLAPDRPWSWSPTAPTPANIFINEQTSIINENILITFLSFSSWTKTVRPPSLDLKRPSIFFCGSPVWNIIPLTSSDGGLGRSDHGWFQSTWQKKTYFKLFIEFRIYTAHVVKIKLHSCMWFKKPGNMKPNTKHYFQQFKNWPKKPK